MTIDGTDDDTASASDEAAAGHAAGDHAAVGDATDRAGRIARARHLRAVEGLSKRQIAERLGVSTGTLSTWLRGVDPPAWTRRPNAKDALAERARQLRAQAWSVPEIAAELSVSKSTASIWVRDIPLDASAERCARRRRHGRAMAEARWSEYRRLRDARHGGAVAAAAGALPALTAAEIRRCGALIYWCEGSKSKPWRRAERVTFINSDPGLISFFLAFLRCVGVAAERIQFRVVIHESADVTAAVGWWADHVGAPATGFLRPTLKRHRPRTVRRNVGDGYRGCLVVDVKQSRELYWMIEGIVAGTVRSVAEMSGAIVKLSLAQDVSVEKG